MYKIEIIQLKNTVTEFKNSVEEFDSRLDQVEELIGKFEVKSMEICKPQKHKKMKKSENTLRDL